MNLIGAWNKKTIQEYKIFLFFLSMKIYKKINKQLDKRVKNKSVIKVVWVYLECADM